MSQSVDLRPGTVEDSYSVFLVFEESLSDLVARMMPGTTTSFAEPDALARMWEERRPLYEHLARTAEHFWVAERDGQVIGFARSILRDGLRQLTELFIMSGQQSAGLGQRLLRRAFPSDDVPHRSIIASPDLRAQALYLRSGVYPRFPIYYFSRRPEAVSLATDLIMEPITASPDVLDAMGRLDEFALSHRRDADHVWLMSDRQGYLYLRGGEPVGYGYVDESSGPFVLLQPEDFPAVLAHAESQAAAADRHFGLEVPMINKAAVDYLLARGFRMEAFTAQLFSDVTFGNFEHYIVTAPPFFL